MRTTLNRPAGNRSKGSVLVIILVLLILAGTTLASYLRLVSNQNSSINRSLLWNTALPVAEGGIEEALAHLNRNTTNRAVDNWQVMGTNVYRVRSNGLNKVEIYINKDIDPPRVMAKGYVFDTRANKFFDMPRTIVVGTTNDSLFAKGMVAKGQIDLAGNNIKTDSFDSSDPAYNTGGRYDSTKNKDNGDVATNSSVIDSLNVWNADIFGSASTGPGGTVRIGPNGSVGDKAWHAAGKKGIQAGHARDDMNVEFPDVKVPFSGGASSVVPGSYLGTNYAVVVGTGNYQTTSLALTGNGGNATMLVTGTAAVYVSGDVSLTGQSKIIIAPGAHLDLYVGGSASFGGNGVLNLNSSAFAFGYWGLNSNTSVSLSGNASFTGTFYAPYAAVTLGGGGNNTYDFVGALVASSIKLNGHYNFHYDEALGKFGPRRGYTIISWNETTSWDL